VDAKVTFGTAEGRYGISSDLLAELCDRAPDAICVIERRANSPDYVFRYVNRAFEVMYGCRRDVTLGSSVDAFMRDRSSSEDRERVNEALDKHDSFRIRRGFTRADGTFIWIEANFSPIPWDAGNRWMFITRDATREKRAHERMVQLTTAVEHGYDPVAICDASNRLWVISYVNDAFTRITGYLPEEVVGKLWTEFLWDERDVPRLETMRAALFAGQQVRTEISYRRKDGRHGMFEVYAQPIQEPATREYTSIVCVFRDITEARQREAKLLYEAEHDLLTELFNRRYFERSLETAISMTRSAPMHALLFADLDGFKEVNDRLGHEIGDDVLRAAGRAFDSAVFRTDVLARWGGDEFTALLYHCSLENAVRTAEEMAAAFGAAPDRYGVTVSIGIVLIRAGEGVSDLIRRADRMCYKAKAAGRNRVLADSEPVRV
jgi:diguanylate cyclase (GGDEF)-like protein/PAS domain S-box-containing protein